MGKKVLVLASNVGLWAEELQAPWDALRKAGHDLTLATHRGLKPLPLVISMDPEFIDPFQNYNVNPVEVVERTRELMTNGEWDEPIKIKDAKMSDYDAIVIVGGPGSALDLVGNPNVHDLLGEAYKSQKIMGALCYAVGAFVWTRRESDDKSIIYGKNVAAHPRQWDFKDNMDYKLVGSSADNPGTDLITPGFAFPLEVIVEDAVGDPNKVESNHMANRENPVVVVDLPFVTALSVESSIAFGDKLVEVLA
ncbi:MAG: DJ-1/PfpI family protein [Chloroflexota bacterium]|nr:DJ-1/PfpI family protein [Chloroflexota bacterium]